MDVTQAGSLRTSLGVDYLIWGALTVMGQECSLDINVLDPQGHNQPWPTQTTLSQVIPSLEIAATNINDQVFGRQKQTPTPAQKTVQPMNEAMIVNETHAGTAYANPSLKYEEADSSLGRWRSQTFPFASRGMVVCDGDGDGQNEVFLLTDNSVIAYRMVDRQLQKITELVLPRNRNYVRLNAADLNRNGRHELIIAAAVDKDPRSLILEFNGSNFSIKDDHIPYFIGILNMPPAYMPTLVGQSVGRVKYLDSKIHHMIKQDGKYVLGPAVNVPLGGTVFNITFLPHENDYQIIMIDDYDHLRIYSSDGGLLTTTEETYAGSNLGIDFHTAALGLKAPDAGKVPQERVFIPLRGIPSDLDKDGRFELIISHNISVASQFFSRYRDYPQGEIHSLYWDGVGMSLQWKTARIKGTVVDYALTDLDNDGVLDLVVNINTHTGMAGTTKRKTMLVAYPLDLSKFE